MRSPTKPDPPKYSSLPTDVDVGCHRKSLKYSNYGDDSISAPCEYPHWLHPEPP